MESLHGSQINNDAVKRKTKIAVDSYNFITIYLDATYSCEQVIQLRRKNWIKKSSKLILLNIHVIVAEDIV